MQLCQCKDTSPDFLWAPLACVAGKGFQSRGQWEKICCCLNQLWDLWAFMPREQLSHATAPVQSPNALRGLGGSTLCYANPHHKLAADGKMWHYTTKKNKCWLLISLIMVSARTSLTSTYSFLYNCILKGSRNNTVSFRKENSWMFFFCDRKS